ncbi:MAG: porphobilinogen synthase, partial [Alphaproteobacteria bacterium]
MGKRPLPGGATPGAYPTTRLRRNRSSAWVRALVRETTVSVDDLIWPIFLIEGTQSTEPVATMPGVVRYTIDRAVEVARKAHGLRIPVLALFPNTAPEKRDDVGTEATNHENLVCRATRAIRDAGVEIGLLTDVALDPYTSHGHDGLLQDGRILNDETVEMLVRQAVVQAQAGTDI